MHHHGIRPNAQRVWLCPACDGTRFALCQLHHARVRRQAGCQRLIHLGADTGVRPLQQRQVFASPRRLRSQYQRMFHRFASPFPLSATCRHAPYWRIRTKAPEGNPFFVCNFQHFSTCEHVICADGNRISLYSVRTRKRNSSRPPYKAVRIPVAVANGLFGALRARIFAYRRFFAHLCC